MSAQLDHDHDGNTAILEILTERNAQPMTNGVEFRHHVEKSELNLPLYYLKTLDSNSKAHRPEYAANGVPPKSSEEPLAR